MGESFSVNGVHKGVIYNKDCLEGMANMTADCVDLIITDPPYKTITGGRTDNGTSKIPQGILRQHNKPLFKHQMNIKISSWIGELYRVLKSGGQCYIFINALNMKELLVESEKVGFKLHNILVWEKNNCTPSQFYMKNCEYVLFLRKGRAKWINDIGGSKTVHQFNNIIGNKNHPTEKPVDLLTFYIKNSSEEGDVVFDPFMGSGSTMIAALRTNRQFIGYELDEQYYDVASRRIKEELS